MTVQVPPAPQMTAAAEQPRKRRRVRVEFDSRGNKSFVEEFEDDDERG